MRLFRCLRVCLLCAPGLTACGPDWDALLHVQRGDAGSPAVELSGTPSAPTAVSENTESSENTEPSSVETDSAEPGSVEPGSSAELPLPSENADDASLIGSFASDAGAADASAPDRDPNEAR